MPTLSTEARRTRQFFSAVIVLNLAVLTIGFIIPRGLYIVTHWSQTPAQLQEASGTYDLPNMHQQTYRVVHRVRELLPENATVLMPRGDAVGSFHSAARQVLYPRRVWFANDTLHAQFIEAAGAIPNVYQVVPSKELCAGKNVQRLAGTEWHLCQLG